MLGEVGLQRGKETNNQSDPVKSMFVVFASLPEVAQRRSVHEALRAASRIQVQSKLKSNPTPLASNRIKRTRFTRCPAVILLKVPNLSRSANVCQTVFASPHALALVPPSILPALLSFSDSPSAGSILPLSEACSALGQPSAP